MTVFGHFFTVLKALLRYSWLAIASPLALSLTAGLVVSLLITEAHPMGKAWALILLFSGIVPSVYLWAIDIRERRTLGLLQLPVHPAVTASARLAVPAVLHLLILLPFLAFVPLWIGHVDGEVSRIFEKALGLHAFSLVFTMLVYLTEEVTVRVYRWKVIWVVLFQLGLAGMLLFFFFAGGLLGLPEMDSFPGIVLNHLSAAVMAGLTVWLYQRRTNFLLGVDACTSLPVNWSSSKA